MIRALLPALPVAIAAFSLSAQADDIASCKNTPYNQSNCVPVLACMGEEGVWFDGRARGWDSGTVSGRTSTGASCTGTWTADGALGTGRGEMTCDDGVSANVIYYSQDGITGTVIGRGLDNQGRIVQVWTGENVLQFLTGPGAFGPALPCVFGDIPLS